MACRAPIGLWHGRQSLYFFGSKSALVNSDNVESSLNRESTIVKLRANPEIYIVVHIAGVTGRLFDAKLLSIDVIGGFVQGGRVRCSHMISGVR
jgi:hypothetical protein